MDMGFELSLHTRDMLKEREIREEWVLLAVDNPDWTKKGDDNNIHYFRVFQNMENEFFMWL